MHVLLVEDDLETRDLVQHALRKEGCQVFQAFCVSDALRLSRMHPDIDVVVVDMHRGCRQSIDRIMQQMRQRLRHGRYVLISGDWDTLEPACRSQKDIIVLRKPYGTRELLRAIGLCVTHRQP
jgi:DNA-binding response OmpR family regulator